MQTTGHQDGLPATPDTGSARRVLVVDDSRAQRKLLSMALSRRGYLVTEAASGEEALALCQDMAFDIVISDWMMEGMTGLHLCQAFRALTRDRYGYFILLTSKSEKTEIADGLDGGADDFLAKPVSGDELIARLRAGERILSMQQELVEKNRVIGATLAELQELYDSLDRDLVEARKLQETLISDRYCDFGQGAAAIMMRNSGRIGGDLVGWFRIDSQRIALYSVDVSGHGIASAMMTARLAGLFSGAAPEQNIALAVRPDGTRDAWPPEVVAARFNRLMIEDLQVDQYFTLAYAEVNLSDGRVKLVQAGHPHPVVQRAGGGIERLGHGGLPIGLVPHATFDRIEMLLLPGDRLFLMSDGLTECPDPDGAELGDAGLRRMLEANAGLDIRTTLEALIWDLNAFAGGRDFPDDVSGVLFEYRGAA